MKKLCILGLLVFFSQIIIGQGSANPIGSYENPALSAAQIIVMNPSAIDTLYWLDPDGNGGDDPFEVFCDMTTDGGGWTLVLLNNAGVSTCPKPTWNEVVNEINYNGTLSADITSFDLFLGVKYWNVLGTEMRLDMGAGPASLSHRASYDFSLDEANYYALNMSGEVISIQAEGTTASPGMYSYHNGRPLSTCDADHDAYTSSCANNYNCASWWYGSCWSGSFWGGGGESFQDAPYWYASGAEYFSYGSIWVRGTWTPVLPTVTTQTVSDITYSTATGNGNITDLGSPDPTTHGLCWNTTGTPDTTDNFTNEGGLSSTGAFTSPITGLQPGITYYVRAYATNFAGINYGNEVSFTTTADVTPPTVQCKDTVIYLDAGGMAEIDTGFINAGTSDDFSLDTVFLSRYEFNCTDAGDNPVWLYAADASGNMDSCQASVVVADTIFPALTVQEDTVYISASGNASVSAGNLIVLAEDNCDIADTIIYPAEVSCSDLGIIDAEITIEDSNGNTTSKTTRVTVMDTISPELVTRDATVYLDDSGNASLEAGDVILSAADNCTLADSSINPSIFSCTDLGTVTVGISVEDGSGNSVTGTAQVTIADNISPVIACPEDQDRDADNSGTYTVSGNEFGPVLASDNCSYTLLNEFNSSETLSGSVLPAGNTTINWILTDETGNTISCSFTVTVNHNLSAGILLDEGLKVYPNPMQDQLIIEITGSGKEFSIELIDLTGSVIIQKEVTEGKTLLNMSGYPAGIYFIKFTGNDYETRTKIIKR